MKKNKAKLHYLFLVGFAISFLINFSKFLALFNPKLSYWAEHDIGSIPIYLSRLILFTGYCTLILYFNSTAYIENKLKSSRKIFHIITPVILNIGVAIIAFYIFILLTKIVQPVIVNAEYQGLKFAWGFMLLVCFLIGNLIKFQVKQKNTLLEKEQLQKEKSISELNALRDQMDPHFLFNSLNSLNYLINNSQDLAVEFVEKLSDTYRYILKSKEKNLVTINDEIRFIEDYISLMKVRFGNNFNAQINLNLDIEKVKIPVLSLQLLIENAIKHNEITEENPLLVKVYNNETHLIVSNKIKPRTLTNPSTKEGLSNLSQRYQFLIQKEIKVVADEHFTVSIPVIFS